jgi:hypothetical protein
VERSTKLRLREGFQAQRPILQAVIGLGLMAGGGYVVYALLRTLFRGGIFAKYQAAFGALIFLGGWLTWDSMRKGYYLEVETGRSREKFAFRGAVTGEELRGFITRAGSQFGFAIDAGPLN